MKFLKLNKLVVTITVGATLLLAHMWAFHVSFHYPYLGIEVEPTSSHQWYITSFHDNGVAQNVGMQLRDEIIRVDGRPVMQHIGVSKFHSVEQAYSIDVLRNGESLTFDLNEYNNKLTSRYLTLSIAEFILLTIAGFLYAKASLVTSTRILIAVFATMGLTFMYTEASARSDMLAKFILFNSMTLIPLLFVHFMYQLLKEKGQAFFPFYLIKIYYFIIVPFCLLRFVYFFPVANYTIYEIDRMVTLICFAIGCGLNLLFLTFLYRRRRQEYSYSAAIIKTMLTTFGISFVPFILLSVVPDIFGNPIVSYAMSIKFIALFPILFFYFSYKRKLFHIRWSWFESMIIRFSGLFPQHPVTQSMHQIITRLRHVKRLEDLNIYFLSDLCALLNVKHAAVWIWEGSRHHYTASGEINSAAVQEAIEAGRLNADTYTIYSIQKDHHYASYLILEHGSSSRRSRRNHSKYLETINTPLSLVIENVYLSERLSHNLTELLAQSTASSEGRSEPALWLKRSILQLQEQERSLIASDLHDTILQDILYARQRVLSLQHSKMNPKEMVDQLHELGEYLNIIGLNTRDTTFQIYPHMLKEAGFAAAISSLVESERSHSEFVLQLHIEYPSEWDRLSFETQLQLFRMIQELLTNARKHSQATMVQLQLSKPEALPFKVHYQDDGIGIHHHKFSEKTGWRGIRQRAYSLGAEIQIESPVGSGLSVVITINE